MCDLVPLALSESILDDLMANGQLQSIRLEDYPGGIFPVLCNSCDGTGTTSIQVTAFQPGDEVRMIAPVAERCRALNRKVALDGGETFTIAEVFRCFTDYFVYVARSSCADEVCLLHDWVSAASAAPK
jgi:hypothetical protein